MVDDVRMIQRRERLRLVREALRKLRIVHPLRREQLQRDEAVERFLPRLVDDPHAAAAEAFEDFELRKVRGELLRRLGRRLRPPRPRRPPLGRPARQRGTSGKVPAAPARAKARRNSGIFREPEARGDRGAYLLLRKAHAKVTGDACFHSPAFPDRLLPGCCCQKTVARRTRR